jgi:hypothetical protein
MVVPLSCFTNNRWVYTLLITFFRSIAPSQHFWGSAGLKDKLSPSALDGEFHFSDADDEQAELFVGGQTAVVWLEYGSKKQFITSDIDWVG